VTRPTTPSGAPEAVSSTFSAISERPKEATISGRRREPIEMAAGSIRRPPSDFRSCSRCRRLGSSGCPW
jgi:hypothetical protein